MADEKIVCMDQNPSCGEMMALMNNNNNWMNNPFMYLIWLAFFGQNGFGFGGNNNNAGQIAQLQDTVNTNHNNDLAMQAIQGNGSALHELAGNLNIGVNALTGAINQIQSAIQQVGAANGLGQERVINSVITGNKDIAQQLCDCCCQNKTMVQQMGYEGQLRDLQNTQAISNRIDALSNSMNNGFTSIGYKTAEQTNVLQNTLTAQTQTIVDKLCQLENQSLQNRINTLTAELTAANSRAERAAELAPIFQQLSQIKAAQPSTATVTYPQLTAVPNYVAYAYNNANGGGFWG